jgi:hypothetical protein
VLSAFFYELLTEKKLKDVKLEYLVILGSIPLFSFYPQNLKILIISIFLLTLLLIYFKFRNITLGLLTICLVFFFALYISKIVNFPFSISKDLLIYSDRWSNQAISSLQTEALYLPYKLRYLVFNKSIYIYTLMSNIAELFTIKNICGILLLANIYPLLRGLTSYFKNRYKKGLIFYGYPLAVLLATGISRSANNTATFLLLSPYLLLFTLLGYEKINRKIYFLLIILSYFLLTSPIK